ncbi:hypothetical protein [Thiorhodovibrio frisius]|uniref:Phospholipase A2 n=1 Tax=Thiorhodovibrio frisius TaxID=631362 RepID=H8YVF4_9GAMM|nr:hypothetical protein [Thiorhodovibrio frisius]EIC23894.1 hypothetical protein Thi970DRAFT_00028 [Thiorhodovibrio frisius]WPL23142.1 hypothetical protein Thiofri_03325 [Thiorhodovibrio frisius]
MIAMQTRFDKPRVRCAAALVTSFALAASGPTEVRADSDLGATVSDIEQAFELSQHERLRRLATFRQDHLAPFVSDGCSGGLSAIWTQLSEWLPAFLAIHDDRPPWESCCIAHDRAYHAGGLEEPSAQASFDARLRADQVLRACVIETAPNRAAALAAHYGLRHEQVEQLYALIADLMYRSVRLGGGPCTGLPWRWGYGLPDCGLLSPPD